MRTVDYSKWTKEELWDSICDDFFDMLSLASRGLQIKIMNDLLDKMIEINPDNVKIKDLKRFIHETNR